MKHPNQATLALHAGGDLGFFARWRTERHLRECDRCRHEVDAFAATREIIPELADIPASSTFAYTSDLPPTPTVSAPATPTAEGCGLVVDWTPAYDPAQLAGYVVFRSTVGGSFRQVSGIVQGNAFTDASARRSVDYLYSVQSVDLVGLQHVGEGARALDTPFQTADLSGHALQQGRFTGPVRPDQREQIPGPDRPIEMVDRRMPVVAEGQADKPDRGRLLPRNTHAVSAKAIVSHTQAERAPASARRSRVGRAVILMMPMALMAPRLSLPKASRRPSRSPRSPSSS